MPVLKAIKEWADRHQGLLTLGGVVLATGQLLLALGAASIFALVFDAVFGVGTEMLLAILATVAGALLILLHIGTARLPRPTTAAENARPDMIETTAQQDREREGQYRRTAQEALTTLEFQRAKLVRGVDQEFNPWHQGAWPQNRDSFFEEPRNANAGRLTERAFIALGNVPKPMYRDSPGVAEALAAIDAAIPALEGIAGIDRDS